MIDFLKLIQTMDSIFCGLCVFSGVLTRPNSCRRRSKSFGVAVSYGEVISIAIVQTAAPPPTVSTLLACSHGLNLHPDRSFVKISPSLDVPFRPATPQIPSLEVCRPRTAEVDPREVFVRSGIHPSVSRLIRPRNFGHRRPPHHRLSLFCPNTKFLFFLGTSGVCSQTCSP